MSDFSVKQKAPRPIHPGARIGHGHLRTADIDRVNYPTRAGLADALRRLREVDWPIRQASDHGTQEAICISDPDGNDLEPAWDRPLERWPRDPAGRVRMGFGDLDLDRLLSDAPEE